MSETSLLPTDIVSLSPLLTFWASYALILVLPGPNMLAVAALAATRGFRGALPLAVGIACGVATLASLILFLAKGVTDNPVIAMGTRWGGALLLLAVAWRIAWPSRQRQNPAGSTTALDFGGGLLTALGNPVSAGFFLGAALSVSAQATAVDLAVMAAGAGCASLTLSLAVAFLIVAAAGRHKRLRVPTLARLGVAGALAVLATTNLMSA